MQSRLEDRRCRPQPGPGRARWSAWRRWGAASALLASAAFADHSARITTDAPIINWRLPSFTSEGYRESEVRGSEARMLSDNEAVLSGGLTITLFSGDSANRPETILLSQTARIDIAKQVVTSVSPIRVINDKFDATATGWRYEHDNKRITLEKNVRVAFKAEIQDILK